ncbi:MAG: hypothetical protein KC731_39880 [Myxococcales bacterium]|nr:hypothetical protein [Myxococcales bacterium]
MGHAEPTTAVEHYILEQVRGELADGEPITHYAAFAQMGGGGSIQSAVGAKGYLAALTPTRILMVETRVGAIEPLMENRGLTVIPRDQIQAAFVSGSRLVLSLNMGSMELNAQAGAKKHLPGQDAFLAEIVAAHGLSEAATAMKKRDTLRRVGSTILGLVLAGGIFAYRMHFGKAEVEVSCRGTDQGFECAAKRVSGGAKAHTCWDLVLTCQAGQRPAARTCVDVKNDEPVTVTLEDEDFKGLDGGCTEITDATVANMNVKVD